MHARSRPGQARSRIGEPKIYQMSGFSLSVGNPTIVARMNATSLALRPSPNFIISLNTPDGCQSPELFTVGMQVL